MLRLGLRAHHLITFLDVFWLCLPTTGRTVPTVCYQKSSCRFRSRHPSVTMIPPSFPSPIRPPAPKPWGPRKKNRFSSNVKIIGIRTMCERKRSAAAILTCSILHDEPAAAVNFRISPTAAVPSGSIPLKFFSSSICFSCFVRFR